MVRWLRWYCPPDTGFVIQALAVWGRARYLSVTEAPHNTDFHTWMGKKHFCFFHVFVSECDRYPTQKLYTKCSIWLHTIWMVSVYIPFKLSLEWMNKLELMLHMCTYIQIWVRRTSWGCIIWYCLPDTWYGYLSIYLSRLPTKRNYQWAGKKHLFLWNLNMPERGASPRYLTLQAGSFNPCTMLRHMYKIALLNISFYLDCMTCC